MSSFKCTLDVQKLHTMNCRNAHLIPDKCMSLIFQDNCCDGFIDLNEIPTASDVGPDVAEVPQLNDFCCVLFIFSDNCNLLL